jgi:hypothetical protein
MTGTTKAPAGLPPGVIGVLDQVLLILMIVELLYTVQLSLREHVLVPEPFRARRAHCRRTAHPRGLV